MKNLSIGSDPEGFLFNPRTNRYVSSEGLLGGSKESPRPVQGGAILEDNVTAEFNTTPVYYEDGAKAFVDSITSVRDQLKEIIAESGYELHFKSTAKFSERFLRTAQGMKSGCDPDYNIYTGSFNLYPPLHETDHRFSGGHIHIGHPDIVNNPTYVGLVVASLDASVTAALIRLEGINARTSLYGNFGNFRPKAYGLEYRSAPNLWVDREELIIFVREMVRIAVQDASAGRNWSERITYLRKCVEQDNIKHIPEYMHGEANRYGRDKGWW